ncbi:hypothetical protein HGRIS_007010 [Hohenbuehelia grisea]|uniref:NACHT domain-containing protein n=1 Tax=Hohenbuehelia grisea TaxID=104357 RepID=A0ABR3JBB5_9AGAR
MPLSSRFPYYKSHSSSKLPTIQDGAGLQRNSSEHTPASALSGNSSHISPPQDNQIIQSNGWLTLKNTLTMAKELSDVFPPLKGALSGVITIMDYVEKVKGNQAQFVELAAKIESLQGMFNAYQSQKDVPSAVFDRLDRIAEELTTIQRIAQEKQARGLVKRGVVALKDVHDILETTKKLAALLELMNIQTALDTHFGVNYIVEEALLRGLSHVANAGINALSEEGCLEGTRVKVLESLDEWSRDPNSPPVLWLSGPAGSGKSTIVRSFCHRSRAAALLGGTFFCHRQTASRAKPWNIVPTLAIFLARRDSKYRAALLAILKNPESADVGTLPVDEQFHQLLEMPLRLISTTAPSSPSTHTDRLTLVIDALDECENPRDEVQKLLSKILSAAPRLRVKFLVASRPQRHIRDKFEASPAHDCLRILRLNDIQNDVVEHDIALYLSQQLGDIREGTNQRLGPKILGDWPSPVQLEMLARRSGALFIYASTAVKYVGAEDPTERLQTLTTPIITIGEPLTGDLDQMYRLVLSEALDTKKRNTDEIARTKRVIWAILAAREQLSVTTIAKLLRITAASVRWSLEHVHAVIKVPPFDDGVVSIYHASFSDFLTSRERSPEAMWADLPACHTDLAAGCFVVMESELKFNICGCQSSYLTNLQQKLSPIAPALVYSSQHWIHHVLKADDPASLFDSIESFLRSRLLFWTEVMSATGFAQLCSAVIRLLELVDVPPTLTALIRDAGSFIAQSLGVIAASIPHIYLSALPAVSESSTVAHNYWPEFTRTARLVIQTAESHPEIVWRRCGHTTTVRALSFSPDGARFVSGSDDGTIRIWDAVKGREVMQLEGHSGPVRSVAYSSDGTHLTSVSDDKTVRVWDTSTGEAVMQPFEGHTRAVHSVAFSQDGVWVVSASDDRTVRVWAARTGELMLQPLKGHRDYVRSVAVTPDGTRLASGSDDRSICVWNTSTGQLAMPPLMGHSDLVRAVAFSPDGTGIVSGSYDNTVRIWDAVTGELAMEPLEGHGDSVNCVALSPDGLRIISGSDDQTVRIWGAESLSSTGVLTQRVLEGHDSPVLSVAVSPDGTTIISGSADGTILVWDPSAEEHEQSSIGWHSACVRAVAFSPDGRHIVSGSHDKTIRVWDASTGNTTMPPLKGHLDFIRSIAISPDSTRIYSGSDDRTIHVWDVLTGEMIMQPLKGHSGIIFSVAVSPDGTHIASGSADNTIRVWNASTGEPIQGPFEGHTDFVQSVSFSANGTLVISGSDDKTIRVWDLTTGDLTMPPLEGHTDGVLSVVFSPDGTRVVSCSRDQTIRVWIASTGALAMPPLVGHSEGIRCVAVSRDGTRIASSSDDHTIRVWDASTGKPTMPPLEGHCRSVCSVAFSPDGSRVVSGSDDNVVRVWDVTASLEANPAGSSEEFAQLQSTTTDVLNTSFRGTTERILLLLGMDFAWTHGPEKQVLMWFPERYQNSILLAPCRLVLAQCRISVDTSHFVHGSQWTDCYTPRDV